MYTMDHDSLVKMIKGLSVVKGYSLTKKSAGTITQESDVLSYHIKTSVNGKKITITLHFNFFSDELFLEHYIIDGTTPMVKVSDMIGTFKNGRWYFKKVAEMYSFQKADMGGICSDKGRYDTYRTPTGRISLDCADPVALWLRDAPSVDSAVKAIAKYLDSQKYPLPKDAIEKEWVNDGDGWLAYLNNRYSHLNNGQRRMLAGQILRGAINEHAKKDGCSITDMLSRISVN